MKLPALPLAALALLLAQCRHAEPAPAAPVNPLALLPVESQTGAGTFGCLINGKAYTTPTAGFYASGDYTYRPRLAVNGQIYEDGTLTQKTWAISFLLNGGFLAPTPLAYTVVSALSTASNQATVNCASPQGCYYSGNYIKSGTVLITKFDGAKQIISGRFTFTLYEPGGCDTLRVTDGRFDVKF